MSDIKEFVNTHFKAQEVGFDGVVIKGSQSNPCISLPLTGFTDSQIESGDFDDINQALLQVGEFISGIDGVLSNIKHGYGNHFFMVIGKEWFWFDTDIKRWRTIDNCYDIEHKHLARYLSKCGKRLVVIDCVYNITTVADNVGDMIKLTENINHE